MGTFNLIRLARHNLATLGEAQSIIINILSEGKVIRANLRVTYTIVYKVHLPIISDI